MSLKDVMRISLTVVAIWLLLNFSQSLKNKKELEFQLWLKNK